MSNPDDFISLNSPNLENAIKKNFRLKAGSKYAEMSDADLGQLDFIENTVNDFSNKISETPVDWDMAIIGPVADVAVSALRSAGYTVKYPAFIEHTDGTVEYED